MISKRGATAGNMRTKVPERAFLRLAFINGPLFSFLGAIAIIT